MGYKKSLDAGIVTSLVTGHSPDTGMNSDHRAESVVIWVSGFPEERWAEVVCRCSGKKIAYGGTDYRDIVARAVLSPCPSMNAAAVPG